MRRTIVVVLFCLQACTESPVKSSYPNHWLVPRGIDEGPCSPPVGLFSNQGEHSIAGQEAPALASILFEDKLAGYPVESIRFELIDDGAVLRLAGVLEGVDLKQKRNIPVDLLDCERQAVGETSVGSVDATLKTEAVLYTGGFLFPLSDRYHFSLMQLEDGALLVHVVQRSRLVGAFFVPFTLNDEFWLRYDRWQEPATLTEAISP